MADGKMECVPKKEIKECFFLFLLIIIIFLFSRERWNHAGCLLQDDTGHYREETRVLFCLDFSFIFFMKLVAVIAW